MKINKKIPIIIGILIFILLVIKFAPTLGKIIFQKDKNVTIWDGTIANSFSSGKGTEVDPYIISTPNEFMLIFDNKYNKEGYYFKLNNNLYFNDGIFDYDNDNNQLIYYLKTNKYYLNNNEKYYSDKEFNELKGSINIIDGSYDFKGTLEGQNNFIYGLYINNNNGCLFNTFNGNMSNLKISNSMIISNNNASLINNINSSKLDSIMFNSLLISNNNKEVVKTSIDDIYIEKEKDNIELSIGSDVVNYALKGNTSNEIEINNIKCNNEFYIELESNKLNVKLDEDTTLSNLELVYYDRTTSSFINNSTDTTINNYIFKGLSKSNNYSSGLINNSYNTVINNSYNIGKVISNICNGFINNNTGSLKINNSYNNSDLIGTTTNGFINNGNDSSIEFNNIINFNNNTNNIISNYNKDNITGKNIYYVNDNNTNNDISTYISNDSLLKVDKLKELEFNEEVWNLKDGKIPTLKKDDSSSPSINIKYNTYQWDSIHDVENINIKEQSLFEFSADDEESDILKIEYYLDKNNYNEINYKNLDYTIGDELTITGDGVYVVYVKATDTSGNVSYANSDRLVLNNINMVISFDNKNYKENMSVSSDCPISYQIDTTVHAENTSKLYIETNNELVDNTLITLIDINDNYKEYTYKVNSKDVIKKDKIYYPVSVFGINNEYSNNDTINYSFKFDYSDVDFEKYNSKISFAIINDDNVISSVKENDIKSIKVVKTPKQRFKINCKTSKIDMNKINNKNYTIKVLENTKEDNVYYNYKFGDYRIVSYITFNGLVVKDENIKDNLAFKIYNNNYYIGDDGLVEIPIRTYESQINIKTINDYNVIREGSYTLNIKLQNKKTNKRASNIIEIPITVTPDVYNQDYSFDVNIDDQDTYIDNKQHVTYADNKNIETKIKYTGTFKNPRVLLKVSKLVKNNYEQINARDIFSNYLTSKGNRLVLYDEIKSDKEYTIKLKPDYENLEVGTYKLEFLLYNGNVKVTKYETNILVG